MTPHTLALEACRLLVESYCEHTPAWELRKLHEAREKARQALDASTPDPTTLNISVTGPVYLETSSEATGDTLATEDQLEAVRDANVYLNRQVFLYRDLCNQQKAEAEKYQDTLVKILDLTESLDALDGSHTGQEKVLNKIWHEIDEVFKDE